jgi:peptide/nickel transport system substrate-binding protein
VHNIIHKVLLHRFSLSDPTKPGDGFRHLSPFEKALFGFLIILFAASAFFLLMKVNAGFLVQVPARGGSISEGIIGSPRFINPLLAVSDADRDLTLLIYSGLMRATPEGLLIADLAENYQISEDGLIYTFQIREDAVFHDGMPVTADDVVFTIQYAQDQTLKSPKRANWDGVSVQKTNEREVQFILKQPYAPFLENTTLGILPRHIWKDASPEQFPFSEYNTSPIGSGPYRIATIARNSSGIPTSYTLEPFNRFTLGKPFIESVRIAFYPNEEALLEGYRKREVENINSIAPHQLQGLTRKETAVAHVPLPRIFAVFFNQNQQSVFADKGVREALDVALDKQRIVTEVLAGYGIDITGPIPPGMVDGTVPVRAPLTSLPGEEEASSTDRIAQARAILENAKWVFDEEEGVWKKKSGSTEQRLVFSLSTSNAPELKAAAELIVNEWTKLGVPVELKIFETGDLNHTVIRPRKFDALFFGEIIGRELDLYAFWHSSQRNDPGLNIALYANITADSLLEQARVTSDREEREELFHDFLAEIQADDPAIFVYSPDFIYLLPSTLKGVELGFVTTPGERFLNIYQWYIETDSVWSIFARS